MTTVRAMPARSAVTKRFTTTLAIAATALGVLTAAAIPAHADRQSDNVLKALAGIALFAAIVDSVGRNQHRVAKPQPQPQPPAVVIPEPYVVALPQVCAMPIQGLRNENTAYGERCLINQGFVTDLPRQCAYSVQVNGYHDRVYAENCMLNAGFDIEPRRAYPRY